MIGGWGKVSWLVFRQRMQVVFFSFFFLLLKSALATVKQFSYNPK